jgi:hydrogenase nickel incorporation protein HypA/HybF
MHELSITRSMLDLALAETKNHGAERVSRIRLLLGEGGSVVPDSVRFYFDEMKKGTAAAEAELEFTTVPVRIRCPKCGKEWGMSPRGPSPDGDSSQNPFEEMCTCNAGGEVISGQELVIESIDVD